MLPDMHRTAPHNKGLLDPNVNSTTVEEPRPDDYKEDGRLVWEANHLQRLRRNSY